MTSEVEAWFVQKKHPLDAVMRRVREVILAADPRVTECIKWSAPTFVYLGNLATFNVQAKHFVSLMFHTGAHIPGKHRLLEGRGDTARYVRFENKGDLNKKAQGLTELVQAWCAMRDRETGPRAE